jgi:hypothetical protein
MSMPDAGVAAGTWRAALIDGVRIGLSACGTGARIDPSCPHRGVETIFDRSSFGLR